MSTPLGTVPVAVESISLSIATLREQRVILDSELAALYGVETKRLNEQIKRNAARFPADFMFQLTAEEFGSLRSQFATLKPGRGQHRKYQTLCLYRARRDHGSDGAEQFPRRGGIGLCGAGVYTAASGRGHS